MAKIDANDYASAHGAEAMAVALSQLTHDAEDLSAARKKPRPCLPSSREFPVAALPDPLARYARTRADALGVPPEYVAVPLLASIGGVVGNSRAIRLKRTWIEPAVVWAAIVGSSGTLKSPALDAAVAPARRIEAIARKFHSERIKEYNRALERWGEGKRGPQGNEPERPVASRLLVSDVTTEALAVIADENQRGLLLVRDELGGWLGSFDGYKRARGADEAFWLQAHRASHHSVDRKSGRESIFIPRLAVSVVGTIQPAVLGRMLGNVHFESGLAARLLLIMPQAPPKRWSDKEGDPAADEAMEQIIQALWTLEPQLDELGNIHPSVLNLTPAGLEAWISFYNSWGASQGGDETDAAAASKLEGYAARFALLFALVRDPDTRIVDAIDVKAGSTLAWWFRSETQRIYDVLRASPEQRERHELQDWVIATGRHDLGPRPPTVGATPLPRQR